ncbi:MAG: hypothetical protein Q7U04_07025 [Bacteriovorax sp.]|nr:hypothetical protein [Bacteriovorax sp.]
MKIYSILFLFLILSPRLKAIDFSLSPDQLETFKQLNTVRTKINQKVDLGHKLFYEEEIKDKSITACTHCPRFITLTGQINKVVDKLSKDSKVNISVEQFSKLNNLKFLYYTQALRDQKGNVLCQRFLDLTSDLSPTKFDGQFKLVAEDVLKFEYITEIQYMNPNLEELVYYYRGVGEDKNIIIQAILTKTGGKFRYFRYTPSQKEGNPYNLPDFELVKAKSNLSILPDTLAKGPYEVSEAMTTADKVQMDIAVAKSNNQPDKYDLQLKTELEKHGQYLPKNIHLLDASFNTNLGSDLSIQGNNKTSVKSNIAHLGFKNGDDELVSADAKTSTGGDTEFKVSLPITIRVLEDSIGLKVAGAIQRVNAAKVVTLSVTDKAIEQIRGEYRKNLINDKESYVLARDIKIGSTNAATLLFGQNEAGVQYTGFSHTRPLKENISMIIQVVVDKNKKANIAYQLDAKF